MDPTVARTAYGDRAIPKLNRELEDSDDGTRQRALAALLNMARNPETVTSALSIGMANSLKALMKPDVESKTREMATEVLFHFAGHAVGRQAILTHGLIDPTAALFNDGELAVRKHAHSLLERGAATTEVAAAMVTAGLVPVLIAKFESEVDDIKVLMLATLHQCMKVDTDACLDAKAMEVFVSLTSNTNTTIRHGAARSIMDLSFPLAGKDAAVTAGAVPRLVDLIGDSDSAVRGAALGAMMSIAITTKGKYAALECKAPAAIIPLLTMSEEESVVLNAVKATTVIAEAPEGRAAFLTCVAQLEQLVAVVGTHLDSKALSRAAEIAIKTITWKP